LSQITLLLLAVEAGKSTALIWQMGFVDRLLNLSPRILRVNVLRKYHFLRATNP
jgi:hypothetical protein